MMVLQLDYTNSQIQYTNNVLVSLLNELWKQY
jgi:hypothetical protein